MKLRALSSRLNTMPIAGPKPAPASTIERKRGSSGAKDRAAIRARDAGLCQECKRNGYTRIGHAVDHIIPLHMGGTDDEANKELLCTPCHDAKSKVEAGHRAGKAY